jgi:hypothetical protein
MKNKEQMSRILAEMAQLLDIPESYYEKAVDRYQSMSRHFHRPESLIKDLDPAVYPQGSFRLGTVNRPIIEGEDYDLDLVCRIALAKENQSQKAVKELVGLEVKSYSEKQNFKDEPEEGRRCWTQQYQDDVGFHMDILPSIPASQTVMEKFASQGVEAKIVREALEITDKTKDNYPIVHPDWQRSNPKGYALWFEQRMDIGGAACRARKSVFNRSMVKYASIDEVPTYRVKTPLQRSVQLLKRHRDQMFRDDPSGKPISIIITTLAARAYGGEDDLADALGGILERMGNYVMSTKPRIQNPVDPGEDFADRWDKTLEENFWRWLRQAREDFAQFANPMTADGLDLRTKKAFALSLPDHVKAACVTASIGAPAIVTGQQRPVTNIGKGAAASWGTSR